MSSVSVRLQPDLKPNILSRFRRRCGVEAELAEQRPRLSDLLGIGYRQLTLFNPQASSRPTRMWPPSIAACRAMRHLMAAGADDRPLEALAEEAVCVFS